VARRRASPSGGALSNYPRCFSTAILLACRVPKLRRWLFAVALSGRVVPFGVAPGFL